MKKIICLFKRNLEKGKTFVYDEVMPGAEWVINGEGVATEKFDGTCCMVRDGRLYKRYDAKKGRKPPVGFEPAQDPDDVTGHWPGWLPVGDGNNDRWHREAYERENNQLPDGTYELIGRKINGNPYDLDNHILMPHGKNTIKDVPRDFEGLRAFFADTCILFPSIYFEGVVWHHPDGKMVKIRKRDFL